MNLTNEIVFSIATYLKHLKKLSLAMNERITDISPLNILSNLEYLKIAGCNIIDREIILQFQQKGVEVVIEDI